MRVEIINNNNDNNNCILKMACLAALTRQGMNMCRVFFLNGEPYNWHKKNFRVLSEVLHG